jgi:hypothetical protein
MTNFEGVEGEATTEAYSEVVQVVDDFGAGPVLGVDEFATEDSVAVDDVGLGDLDGAVEFGDLLVGVADGKQVDVVAGEEVLVGGGVLVPGDGDDVELGHLALEGEEAGEFFDAGGAVGGPEVEQDDVAAEFAEVGGVGAVADIELGCGGGDVAGVAAAVAADGECREED